MITKKYTPVLSILLIVILSGILFFTSYVNIDAANALHEAKMLFSGGRYYYDFYETSPPMFLYVFFPIVLLQKIFPSVLFNQWIFLYFLALSLLSSYLCYRLVKNKWLSVTLIFAFLIIGNAYFGQREFMSILFAIPYFFLIENRLQNKIPSIGLSLLIGVLGGIGFSAKPHFCIPFFLIECYYCFYTKKLSSVFRIESITVFAIFVIYLISTYLLYPAYFHIIIPQASLFYYLGIESKSFWMIFYYQHIYYFYLSLLFFFLVKKTTAPLPPLLTTLLIGMIGYTLSYFAGLVTWTYHFFPALIFAFLLNALLIFSLSQKQETSRKELLFLILFSFLVYAINLIIIPFRLNYYIFAFLFLFCISIYIARFSISKIWKTLSLIGLSGLIFFYPLYFEIGTYEFQVITRKINEPLISFLKLHAKGKKVYFFSSVLVSEYPSVDYAQAIHCSRFPYLIWIPAVLRAGIEKTHGKKEEEITHLAGVFAQLLAEDIKQKQPDYILVDTSDVIATPVFSVAHFNYVNYFMQYSAFPQVWKNYHYDTTVTLSPIYRFAVFKRIG